MKLSFIGFSGAGKSFWARKLSQEAGYEHFCCDALIEQKLRAELQESGLQGTEGLAKWMGEPYDESYSDRQRQYLEVEHETLSKFLERRLRPAANDKEKIVVDTTGSLIYLDEELQKACKELTLVVYLDVPESVSQSMFDRYLDDPKPVIWGEAFAQHPGQTVQEALRTSFPRLLRERRSKYEQLAHRTLNYYQLRKPGFSTRDFLAELTEEET